jgi:HSP20 family protein
MKKEMDLKRNYPQEKLSNQFSNFARMTESLFGGYLPSRNLVSNIREKEDAYVLTADMPGLSKEEIDVKVNGNILTIHAEHKSESGDENSEAGYSREFQSYHESFTLPSNVDPDEVEAHCENGRLQIRLPKTETGRQRKIEIKSGKESSEKKSNPMDKH